MWKEKILKQYFLYNPSLREEGKQEKCVRSNEKDGFVTMKCEELKEDDKVRISEGPLAGLTGVFKKIIKGTERVVLLLNAIEYQARVVVERASLSKIC